MCYRYKGGAKEGGPQYPQAIAVGSSLHVIFSLNKEVLLLFPAVWLVLSCERQWVTFIRRTYGLPRCPLKSCRGDYVLTVYVLPFCGNKIRGLVQGRIIYFLRLTASDCLAVSFQ